MSTHRFAIRVKPGASKPRVGGAFGDPPAIIVAVHAQPVDGKANAAVLSALVDALGVRARDIELVAGHTARTKQVAVTVPDESDAALAQRIRELQH